MGVSMNFNSAHKKIDTKTEQENFENYCSFSIKYFDYDAKQPQIFKCKEEGKLNGLCLFHSKEKINEQEKNQKIDDKILASQKSDKPLYLIGYELSKIKINGNFNHPIYLTRSNVEDLDCSGSNISCGDFSGSKITNGNFSKTTINQLDFMGSESKGTIDFSNMNIKEKANFSESQFNEVSFEKSQLFKSQFIGTKFKKADFALAKIKNSEFDGVSFDSCNFVGSIIENTRFFKNNFGDEVNFTGSSLMKTRFLQCEFGILNLDHCIFIVGVFQGTKIKTANFSNSILDKLSFTRVKFEKNFLCQDSTLKNTLFSNSNFKEKCNFRNTEFQDEVKFINNSLKEADFSNARFNGKIFFHNITFETPGKIFFDSVNLSNVSFKNSDISKVNFTNNVKWGGKDGFTILDEELNDSLEKKDVEDILATYRSIRQNYLNRYRYEEADKFLEKEIELKKKYFKNSNSIIPPKELSEEKINDLTNKINDLINRIDKLETKVKFFSDKINENSHN